MYTYEIHIFLISIYNIIIKYNKLYYIYINYNSIILLILFLRVFSYIFIISD